MVKEKSIVMDRTCSIYGRYRICWSAIFAGVFVGIGLAFLLHLYGVAISLSAFSASGNTATALSIGGLIGMLIGVIATMITAGFVAGYMGRHHYYHVGGGLIYGFVTWTLMLLISALIALPLMRYEVASVEALTSSSANIQTSDNQTNVTMDKNKADVKTSTTTTPANSNEVTITTEQLAWTGWIIFGLSFLGALFSCIGACWGMGCRREEVVEVRSEVV